MNEDYSAVATAAKTKARDILRAQMAMRIQERIQKAKDKVVSTIRHYAAVVADEAQRAKDMDEVTTKRTERRDAFGQALGQVPGVDADTLALVTAALNEKYAETDKANEEAAKDHAKHYAEDLARSAEEIEIAKKDLAHANENLVKLNAGELKVDADELKELANRLIEEERVDA